MNSFRWRLYAPIQAISQGRHFFEGLKQHQPEKYKKAVKEFIKAVEF
jgi:hypothetical protein